MDNAEALDIMRHMASKLEDVIQVEDLVHAFAEFMAQVEPCLSEADFAFIATLGGMIYRKGIDKYAASLETEHLLERLRH